VEVEGKCVAHKTGRRALSLDCHARTAMITSG